VDSLVSVGLCSGCRASVELADDGTVPPHKYTSGVPIPGGDAECFGSNQLPYSVCACEGCQKRQARDSGQEAVSVVNAEREIRDAGQRQRDAASLRALADFLERTDHTVVDGRLVVTPPSEPPPTEAIREIADRLASEPRLEPPVEQLQVQLDPVKIATLQLARNDTVVLQVSEKVTADQVHHIKEGLADWLRKRFVHWQGSVLVVPGELSLLRPAQTGPSPAPYIPIGDAPNVVRGGEAIRHGSHGWGNVD